MKRIIFFIIACFSTYNITAQENIAFEFTDSTEIAQHNMKMSLIKDPKILMDSAISFYNANMYHDALEYYKYINDTLGLESAALYYNMGNSAFKMNDLPLAILFYEKALKINPKDEDALFNLGLSNSRIPDKIEVVPEVLPVRWYKAVVSIFTPNQWAYCAIMLLATALILIGLYFLARSIVIRQLGFWAGVVLLLLCIFSFIVAGQATYNQVSHETAIVFSPSVTIKSSPEGSSTDLFVLHEGTKVWILESLNDWHKIKIANGSVGWIPVSAIEEI
ncbi:MAG: tetratricopeptide repeat protein [Bacteroidales bacterium]|jgi:tetratricopeptide (TPR) repeat protein|nr:tetratricopeptide repeat protein [Bacteroidales bacterium]